MSHQSEYLRDLIRANHILHYNNVVDAFGHISIRSPENQHCFIMSANMAPALVRTPQDFVVYNVSDGETEQENAPRGFIERYIHSELYKKYPDVMCVIHSHADDVLPYTVSGVQLKPMFHMAGFIGAEGARVFDEYQDGDHQDLLISNTRMGATLAARFSWGNHEVTLPDDSLILMRKHGFTTWGRSIKEAVYRAVYATKNAKLQTTATLLRGASDGLDGGKESKIGFGSDGTTQTHAMEPLTGKQAKDSEAANLRAVERPWNLWVQEVSCQALYTSPRIQS